MIKRIKLDLIKLLNLSVSNTVQFDASMEDDENFRGSLVGSTSINITKTSSSVTVVVVAQGGVGTYTNSQILTISATNDYVIFTATFNDQAESEFDFLFKAGVFSYDYDGQTTVLLYRLNDERDAVNKNLTYVGYITGKFSAPLGIKNIEIDVVNYDINYSYNYVFIPRLNRYYYVTNIQLTTKDYTRLQLQEDVLMSLKNLIRRQKALVTRYELSDKNFVIDERLPFESRYQVSYYSVEDEEDNSLVNFEFNFNPDPYTSNRFLVVTATYDSQLSSGNVIVGTGGSHGLPSISPTRTDNKHYYIINFSLFKELSLACNNSSADASFVFNVLYLPFEIENIPQISIRQGDYGLAAGNKELSYNHTFESGTAYTYYKVKELLNGNCPYLVIKDFYFPHALNFYDYEPYSNYEIYIPFVSWVPINLYDVEGDRCIIYYSLDFDTGNAVAHLYDITKEKLIWSGECQLGIKMEVTSGNIRENNLQRELNGLKMGMEFLNGAMNAVGGYAKGDYGKMISGIASAGLSIPKGIIQNALIMNRTNVSLGTPENNLYAPNEVKIKCTYRAPYLANEQVYEHINGKPYNDYVSRLDDLVLNTYIEVGEIHFDAKGENIYSTEIDEIVALLKGGVII